MKILATLLTMMAFLVATAPQAECLGGSGCACCAGVQAESEAQTTAPAVSEEHSCCSSAAEVESPQNTVQAASECKCSVSGKAPVNNTESRIRIQSRGCEPVLSAASVSLPDFPVEVVCKQEYALCSLPPGVHISISSTILRN